jgi:hypothetical protein
METSRLTRQSSQLLAVLGRSGARARIDAIDETRVVASVAQGQVSVGGGCFPIACAEQLLRHDLIETGRGSGGRAVYEITDAGRAYLRRQSSSKETAFLSQHQDLVQSEIVVDRARTKVIFDAGEGPLDWLRRRRDQSGEPLIDEASFMAGERLRRDLTLAMMIPSVTTNWSAAAIGNIQTAPGDAAGASDASLAARQRVTNALKTVGPDFADLLIDLCGFSKGLEIIEQERGWPTRSAKVVVKLALARLADHYGFERSARGPAQSRGIRAWRAVVLEGDRCD